MNHHHVTRPTLLEIGETSHLALRTVDDKGISLVSEQCEWLIESGDPSIISVDGSKLLGNKLGEAEIRAVLKNGDPAFERKWTVRVVAPQKLNSEWNLTERPYILFSTEELAVFKDRIRFHRGEGVDFTALWKKLLEQAEGYAEERHFQVRYPSVSNIMEVPLPLQEPQIIPNPDGYVDYPFWTMFSRAVEERLCTLATAYLVTEELKYAEQAKMYLLGLAGFGKWYEFDHRGAEGNLSNAHFVLGAASAYDAIRSMLSEQEKKTIVDSLLCLGLQPLAIDMASTDMHNIVAAKQVAMMFGAAALHGDSPFAAKYMNQSFRYLLSFLDRKVQSSETEGLLYDNVAARHVWMAADLYRRVTGDSVLCDHPYLKDVLPERFFRLLSPGGMNTFPNLSDSFLKLDISYMMSMVASHHSHPVAMWYLMQFESERSSVLMNLRKLPEASSPDTFYMEQPSHIFDTIGWAALRTGWGGEDHLLCFTSSGSANGHNHKDQNNLMLNAAGEWLLTNPGYQDYVPGPKADYTTGTVGHNSLLVNGQGQTLYGGARLTESWLTPGYEVVQGDASESYGGLLKTFLRSLLHLRNSYYIVWDEVEMNEGADRPELLFHTTAVIREGKLTLKPGDVLKGNEVVLQGERASLQLKSVFPLESNIQVVEYPGAESYGPYITIGGTREGKSKPFITLLKPSVSGQTLEVMDCSELSAVGAVGLTLRESEHTKDVIILNGSKGAHQDVAEVVQYGDCKLTGRAAWLYYCTDSSHTSRLSRFASWRMKELTVGQEIRIASDLPVHVSVNCNDSEWTICNEHNKAVTIVIKTIGLAEKQWTLPPGEHKLAWPVEKRGVSL